MAIERTERLRLQHADTIVPRVKSKHASVPINQFILPASCLKTMAQIVIPNINTEKPEQYNMFSCGLNAKY